MSHLVPAQAANARRARGLARCGPGPVDQLDRVIDSHAALLHLGASEKGRPWVAQPWILLHGLAVCWPEFSAREGATVQVQDIWVKEFTVTRCLLGGDRVEDRARKPCAHAVHPEAHAH